MPERQVNGLKRAIYEIKKNPVGRYYFIFRDTEGTALVVSKSFGFRSQLEKCLADIRDTAQVAAIKESSGDHVSPPLFGIEYHRENYTFFLIGFEGEVIFSSEGYSQKRDCLVAVERLKSLSLDAGIMDLA
jgi:uncharacterized protein YegP (UPF0339 family)